MADYPNKLPDDMGEGYCLNVVKLIQKTNDEGGVYLLRVALQTAHAAGWREGYDAASDEMYATAEAAIRKIKEVKSDA